MRKTLALLAGAALLTAPLAIPSAALAAGHGGGGHAAGGFHGGGGGFHGGGNFHGGGGFHGASVGGFRGGFHGGGFRGGHGYYGGGFGWGPAYGVDVLPYAYDYDYAYPDAAYLDPGDGYAPPCGQWVWNPATGQYDWAAAAC